MQMIDYDTQAEDNVNNWAASNYGATPASYTPPAVAQATSTTTPAASSSTGTSDWYTAANSPTSNPFNTPAATTSTSVPRRASGTSGGQVAPSSPTPAPAPAPAPTPAVAMPAPVMTSVDTSSQAPAATSAPVPRTASGTSGGQVRPDQPTYTVPASVNVSAWYLNELGRLPTAAEVAYWQDALTHSPDPQTVYAQFAASAKANGESVTPVSWAQANAYAPTAADPSSLAPSAVDWTALAAATKAPDIDWSKLTVPQIDWSTMPTIPTTDWSTLTPDVTLPTMPDVSIPDLTPTQINTQNLAVRNVQANETVDGQLQMLLAENSPVLQQQRALAMRAAADRGMGNSALAASGADDAMTKAATTIAAQDADTYGKASDYNTTATNQAIMWNADTEAQAERLQAQLKDSAATRQQQLYTAQMNEATQRQQTAQQLAIAQMQDNTQRAQYAQQMAQAQIQDQEQRAQLAQQLAIAQMQDATTRANAAQQLAIAQLQDATTRAGQSNQLSIAQMTDATSRFQSELSSSTSKYNTDAGYKQQMDSQRNSLANNIIMNMDLSPDRKAAMLEQLGLGTSAGYNADGSIKYGTGLAGAVYVIGSTSSDLNFSGSSGTNSGTNSGSGYYNQM